MSRRLFLSTLRLRPDLGLGATRRDAWVRAPLAGVAELAAFEGCTLWLYQRLRGRAVLDALPRTFADALERVARREAAQNLRIDAEAEAIVRWLARAGVPCVLLKGVARRAAVGLYPTTATRGRRRATSTFSYPHRTRRECGTDCGKRATSPPQPSGLRPAPTGATTSRRSWASDGLRSRSTRLRPGPSRRRKRGAGRAGTHALSHGAGSRCGVAPATELLWHGITHAAQEHEMYEGGFRLRYFQDAAVILAAPGAIDWDEIVRRLDSQEVTDRVTTVRWLGAAANLAGTGLPSGLSGVASCRPRAEPAVAPRRLPSLGALATPSGPLPCRRGPSGARPTGDPRRTRRLCARAVATPRRGDGRSHRLSPLAGGAPSLDDSGHLPPGIGVSTSSSPEAPPPFGPASMLNCSGAAAACRARRARSSTISS